MALQSRVLSRRKRTVTALESHATRESPLWTAVPKIVWRTELHGAGSTTSVLPGLPSAVAFVSRRACGDIPISNELVIRREDWENVMPDLLRQPGQLAVGRLRLNRHGGAASFWSSNSNESKRWSGLW